MMDQQNQVSPAEMFDNFFGPALFAPWAKVLIERANLKPGERVLDLACGTGTVARRAAPLVGKAGTVAAVDINPGMLAVARSRPVKEGAQIVWLEGDAAALEFPDGSFDVVLCQQGLQFFPDRFAALREIHRVLRDGGRLAVDLWQSLERHPLYLALSEAEARYLGVAVEDVSAPFQFPKADELRDLLEAAGFRQVRVSGESLDAQFPSPEAFVEMTLYAATAFLPEFDPSDKAAFAGLVQYVSAQIEPVLSQYRAGDRLIFPMYCNIATAEK